MRLPTVLVCGHGRHGKDEVTAAIAAASGLTNAGSLSLGLCPYVAKLEGLPEDVAYARRHECRDLWYRTGIELRRQDPAVLLRSATARGQVVAGPRDLVEVEHAVAEGLFDHYLWVERDWEPDPTMGFGLADLARLLAKPGAKGSLDIILNRGTLLDLRSSATDWSNTVFGFQPRFNRFAA